MKRIIVWTSSLTLVGVVLGLKGMTIHWERILILAGVGAALGFCIGFLLEKREMRKHSQSG